jgi:diaminopimelate epimerase
MGIPSFEAEKIPVKLTEGVRNPQDYTLRVAGEEVRVTPLWVGNPQCVKFVATLPQLEEFEATGKALEEHPFFPERTNVSFVEILDRNQIRIKIWERGVGHTHSSGTGSSGAGVAAIAAGKARSPVEVRTETGSQIVAWKPSEEVMLTGEATFVADFNFHWE